MSRITSKGCVSRVNHRRRRHRVPGASGRTYTVCHESLSRISKRNLARPGVHAFETVSKTVRGKRGDVHGDRRSVGTFTECSTSTRPQQVAQHSADLTVCDLCDGRTRHCPPPVWTRKTTSRTSLLSVPGGGYLKSGQNFGRTPCTRLFLPNRRRV